VVGDGKVMGENRVWCSCSALTLMLGNASDVCCDILIAELVELKISPGLRDTDFKCLCMQAGVKELQPESSARSQKVTGLRTLPKYSSQRVNQRCPETVQKPLKELF